MKAIRRLEKLLDPDDAWFDDLDKVATLDAEEAEAVRKTVAAMKARCEELEGRLAPAKSVGRLSAPATTPL